MKQQIHKWFLLLVFSLFILVSCSKSNEDSNFLNSDQYITWKLNGVSGMISKPTDTLILNHNNNTTSLACADSPALTTYVQIFFDGAAQSGTYTSNRFQFSINGKNYEPSSTPLQINIKSFGAIGQIVSGSYSGKIKESFSSVTEAISGNFQLKRR